MVSRVSVGGTGEHLQRRQLLQGANGVGVRIGAQDPHRGDEFGARLGIPAPQSQHPAGRSLDAGGVPVLAVLQVISAGPTELG